MSNMRRTLSGMLRSMGYEKTLEAANGKNALEKIRAGKIDFIVTDWNMPGMSGFELLKNIRSDEDNKNIPILMITAEITEGQIAHAAETLVDGYIIKPFVFYVFATKMKEVLAKRSKPHPIDTLVNVASILIKGKQIDRAIGELKKGITKFPKSARLYMALAEAVEANGDLKEAENLLRKGTEVNPLFTRSHEHLAVIQKKNGNTAEALKSYERAAKISPNNPNRQREIGMIHMENGDKTKAKIAFNVALKQAGNDNELSSDIGEAFMKAGMDDQAANAFKQVLNNDPKNLNVYNRLGIALRKKGRFREAIAEYKKAILIAPDDEVLYFNLAKAYFDSKKFEDSLATVEQSLKIDPEFQEAKELIDEVREKIRLLS